MKTLLMLVVILVLSCSQVDQEKTIYLASCKGEILHGYVCKGRVSPEARMTFKINFERQEVIYWLEGSYSVPSRLNKCVARDKNHWKCEYGDHSWYMDDGEFRSNPQDRSEYIPISMYKWWYLYITNWVKGQS
jgi:hypothetical protein